MTIIEIKSISGRVLWSGKAASVKGALENAVLRRFAPEVLEP